MHTELKIYEMVFSFLISDRTARSVSTFLYQVELTLEPHLTSLSKWNLGGQRDQEKEH